MDSFNSIDKASACRDELKKNSNVINIIFAEDINEIR